MSGLDIKVHCLFRLFQCTLCAAAAESEPARQIYMQVKLKDVQTLIDSYHSSLRYKSKKFHNLSTTLLASIHVGGNNYRTLKPLDLSRQPPPTCLDVCALECSVLRGGIEIRSI